MRLLIVVGVILIAVAAVWALADSGQLSKRMPTQVVPSRYARLPLAAGVVLLATGLALAFGRAL